MAIYNSVQLHLLTGSKSLSDVISEVSRTNENRLMLDIYATRQGYKEQEISNIGFVRSNHNIADGLKKSKNQEVLRNVISTGKMSIEAGQWIIHKPEDAHDERY